MEDNSKYRDMLFMDHPELRGRVRMSRESRAAQFSPFAALTGLDAAIHEEGRMTFQRRELDEDEKELVNAKLQYFTQEENHGKEVTITYFKEDEKKEGGSYVNYSGVLKKVDLYERKVIFQDGVRISLDDILDISETA